MYIEFTSKDGFDIHLNEYQQFTLYDMNKNPLHFQVTEHRVERFSPPPYSDYYDFNRNDGKTWCVKAERINKLTVKSKEEKSAEDAVKKAEESLKAAKKTLEAVKNKS